MKYVTVVGEEINKSIVDPNISSKIVERTNSTLLRLSVTKDTIEGIILKAQRVSSILIERRDFANLEVLGYTLKRLSEYSRYIDTNKEILHKLVLDYSSESGDEILDEIDQIKQYSIRIVEAMSNKFKRKEWSEVIRPLMNDNNL